MDNREPQPIRKALFKDNLDRGDPKVVTPRDSGEWTVLLEGLRRIARASKDLGNEELKDKFKRELSSTFSDQLNEVSGTNHANIRFDMLSGAAF